MKFQVAHSRRQSARSVLIVILMAVAVCVGAWFILGSEAINELLGTNFPTGK